jgi:LAO/AO transport system kinase
MGDLHGHQRLDVLARKVLNGSCDPYAAADELVEGLTDGGSGPRHQPG